MLGQLTYNGITLYIVRTNSVTQTAIYTDDGIDYLYTRFRIDINTIYNPSATSYENTDPPVYQQGFLPSQTNLAIRHFLMQPRAELIFEGFINPPNGSPAAIVDSPQENPSISPNLYPTDANNGPVPVECTIISITSDRTFHIHYVIETWLIECPVDPQNPLLSNRFNQSEYIDDQYLTTRKTIGQAYFRTDVLESSGVVAGAFRSNIIAYIPPLFGFKRESVNFTVSPRKNLIQYEIVDRELMYSMGDTIANQSFITKVDSVFSQGTMADDRHGAASLACAQQSMTVGIWGMRNSSNWVMTQVAMTIVEAKMRFDLVNNTAFIRHIGIVQRDTDRYIEVNVVLQVFNEDNNKGIFFDSTSLKRDDNVSKVMDQAGTLLNPSPPQDRGSAGSISIDILAADLREACSSPSQTLGGVASSTIAPQYPVGITPIISVIQDDFLPSQPTNIKPTTPPYNRNYTESRYDYQSGAIQAPIANPKDPSSSSSGNELLTPGALFKSEILNFTTPTICLTVDWWTERIVKPPDIPHPVKNIAFLGSDMQPVLKSAFVRPYSVAVANDLLTPIFTVSGTYEYLIPQAPDPTNPPMIVFDIPPNLNFSYGDAQIGSTAGSPKVNSDYIHGIIDSGDGSSTG